jgi:hypothetical protein
MRRRIRKIAAVLAVSGLVGVGVALPGTASAAAPPCEPGAPGCKTADDPTKNNDKFSVTQRGNFDAPGTENTCTGANPGQTNQVC